MSITNQRRVQLPLNPKDDSSYSGGGAPALASREGSVRGSALRGGILAPRNGGKASNLSLVGSVTGPTGSNRPCAVAFDPGLLGGSSVALPDLIKRLSNGQALIQQNKEARDLSQSNPAPGTARQSAKKQGLMFKSIHGEALNDELPNSPHSLTTTPLRPAMLPGAEPKIKSTIGRKSVREKPINSLGSFIFFWFRRKKSAKQ